MYIVITSDITDYVVDMLRIPRTHSALPAAMPHIDFGRRSRAHGLMTPALACAFLPLADGGGS